MLDKTQLFIAAGAQEIWLVTESGNISFYSVDGKIKNSQLDINIDKITLNI